MDPEIIEKISKLKTLQDKIEKHEEILQSLEADICRIVFLDGNGCHRFSLKNDEKTAEEFNLILTVAIELVKGEVDNDTKELNSLLK